MIPPEAVAEEALGSGETPSQQAPKVTCKDSQDPHLVKPSPEDVSSEPLRSDANSPPGTHHASKSRTTTGVQIKLEKAVRALATARELLSVKQNKLITTPLRTKEARVPLNREVKELKAQCKEWDKKCSQYRQKLDKL